MSTGSEDRPVEGAERPGAATDPGASEVQPQRQRGRRGRRVPAPGMLPGRERRRFGVERLLMRLVATSGIVGIGVAVGAILVSQKVSGWITGLVIALVSVILSAILWSSRQL